MVRVGDCDKSIYTKRKNVTRKAWLPDSGSEAKDHFSWISSCWASSISRSSRGDSCMEESWQANQRPADAAPWMQHSTGRRWRKGIQPVVASSGCVRNRIDTWCSWIPWLPGLADGIHSAESMVSSVGSPRIVARTTEPSIAPFPLWTIQYILPSLWNSELNYKIRSSNASSENKSPKRWDATVDWQYRRMDLLLIGIDAIVRSTLSMSSELIDWGFIRSLTGAPIVNSAQSFQYRSSSSLHSNLGEADCAAMWRIEMWESFVGIYRDIHTVLAVESIISNWWPVQHSKITDGFVMDFIVFVEGDLQLDPWFFICHRNDNFDPCTKINKIDCFSFQSLLFS